MSDSADLPSDSPAMALAETARRRGLRYSRAHVRERMDRHPQAGSLLALVEVAPSLGLKPTAGEGDLETLDSLEPGDLPVVLHFAADGEQGFGLLEAVLPAGAGFRVWDRHAGGRVLSRQTLSALWSGVVVFLEPEGRGEPEPGAWHRRARERLLEDWRPRTGLVGPRGSPLARWGLGALTLVLLVLAVLAQPPGRRWLAAAVAGLTALGLGAALTAAAWTRGSKAVGLCGTGGRLDCDSVLLSDWSHVGGVPLSGLGAAFFGASLLAQGAAALTGSAAPLWLAGVAFLAAVPMSVLLVGVQVVMKRFCTLCMTVHAVDVAGAALFLFGVWPALPGPPPGLLPAALLWLLLFGLLLAAAVPTLLRDEAGAEALRSDYTRLLRSPLVTLAQLQALPAVPVDGDSVGAELGASRRPRRSVPVDGAGGDAARGTAPGPGHAARGDGAMPGTSEVPDPSGRSVSGDDADHGAIPPTPEAPHTLVVLVHPSCHACGPVMDGLEALVEAAPPGTLRAFVGVVPRLDDPRDTALCQVLASAGAAWGGEALVQLYRAVKADFTRFLAAADPAAELTSAAGLDAGALARHEDAGLTRVREATALRAHTRGLPALFLDGRRCEAPMAHLEAWLTRPELRALLGHRPRAPEDGATRNEDSRSDHTRLEGAQAP